MKAAYSSLNYFRTELVTQSDHVYDDELGSDGW